MIGGSSFSLPLSERFGSREPLIRCFWALNVVHDNACAPVPSSRIQGFPLFEKVHFAKQKLGKVQVSWQYLSAGLDT